LKYYNLFSNLVMPLRGSGNLLLGGIEISPCRIFIEGFYAGFLFTLLSDKEFK